MTLPVPDRLVPLRREVTFHIQGAQMLALLAAIVFAVVLFGGHIADLDLMALGLLLLLSLHFVWTVALPIRRQ